VPRVGVLDVVVAGLELPPQPMAASRNVAVARAMSCSGQRRRRPKSARSPNGRVAAKSMLWKLRDNAVVATLAWKVRVAVAAVAPSAGVTVARERVQAELVGAPVQPSATACLKPPVGVMVMVDVTLELRATVAAAGERAIEKSAAGTEVMMMARPAEVEEEKPVAPPYAAVMV
jgi:hypothetical protein